MANQFYYQIVDNTLYYGANVWEGATLLEGNNNTNNNYIFDLYNLSFTSIMPKDDSIVVIDIDKLFYSNETSVPYPNLFNIKNSNNYNILDFRNITVKGIHSGFKNGSNTNSKINECYFWDGWENLTLLPIWTYGKIGSVKYANGYLPDFMNSKYTFRFFYSGTEPISIGYHYVWLNDMASSSARYNTDDWIYCPNCDSITFRSPIKWATMTNHNLGRITYKGGNEIDLSNIYTQYGSYLPGNSEQYIVKTSQYTENLKLYHLEGVVGTNVYLSDTNYPIFSDTFGNIELNGLINCQTLQGSFAGMKNLLTVKLTGNNKLRNAYGLFYNCSKLTTIYTTELWNENLTANYAFYGCTSLVGGNGTVYNGSKIDATMMHVDRVGQEGYFTYNKATDYYKVYVPHEAVTINYPETLFSKGDNVTIAFMGYSKDTALDYWLQYDQTTKRYKNIGSQNPLTFEILSDTALIPIVKKGTPAALYNVDLTSVPSNACTLTGAGAYMAGDNVIITASPNEGYIFKQWEELINDTWIVLSDNKVFTIEAIGRDRTIRAVCVEYTPEIGATLILTDDGNGTTFGSGQYLKGRKVEAAASANKGYKFVKWVDTEGNTVSASKVYTFIINEDTTLQAIFAQDPYYNGGSSGTGGGGGNFDNTSDIVGGEGDDHSNVLAYTGGLFTAFVLGDNDVTQFKNYMYNTDLIAGMKSIIDQIGTLGGQVSDYILNFMKLPVDIVTTNRKDAQIGFYHTSLNFAYANSIGMQVGMGALKVEPYWGNALDYKSKIQLYLPYIGYEYLDTAEVMGKTIGIKYNISFVDGSCVALIYVDDNLKYQFNGNCATNLPISQVNMTEVTQKALSLGASVITAGASAESSLNALTQGNATANIGTPEAQSFASSQINKGNQMASKTGDSIQNAMSNVGGNVRRCSNLSGNLGMLSSQTPYLIISRPRLCMPDNYAHYHGYPSNITRKLGELSGYTVVSNIHLEGLDATSSEIEELESILKSGIIIK